MSLKQGKIRTWDHPKNYLKVWITTTWIINQDYYIYITTYTHMKYGKEYLKIKYDAKSEYWWIKQNGFPYFWDM